MLAHNTSANISYRRKPLGFVGFATLGYNGKGQG